MIATPKIRLTVLCILPVILSCVLTSLIVYQLSVQETSRQNTHFARVFTSHLAMSSAQYLVNEDLLGINVVLNQMHKDKLFDFASIYNVNDQLVAQVGKRQGDALVTSHEITFQDSTAGYVQVGHNLDLGQALASQLVTIIVLGHTLFAIFVIGLIWLGADFVVLWVLGSGPKPPTEDTSMLDTEPSPEVENESGTLLVLKLVPARLTPKYEALVSDAAAIYGGREMETDTDDLVFQFRRDNAGFSASCAGLLIGMLITEIGKPLRFKLGLHWSDEILKDIHDPALKHVSYLASIGDNVVLASKVFIEQLSEHDQIKTSEYRGSLAPDGEVFEIQSVENHDLLKRQATQLLERR